VAKKTTETESETETEAAAKPEGGKKKGEYQEPVPVHIGGESLVDRLVPHVKKIAIVAGLVAVVLLAVFGYRWWRDRGRAKETTELAAALDVARREVVEPEPAPEPDPTNPTPVPAPTPDPDTFPSQKARAEAILAQLDKGGAGKVGAVYRGGLLLDAGRLDEAQQAYQSASGAGGLDGVLAREGLGFVHEARALAATDAGARQKEFEAALAAFRSAQPDDAGPRRDHALYHEARILEQLEKKPEAVAALEKALVVAPETELQSVINDRLAQLEGP
jgi:predicted negative regulator of RcsB-dependent stress response